MGVKLTGRQKAALIIANLEQAAAIAAVKSFSEEELFLLFQSKKEIEKLELDKKVVESVLQEYLDNLQDLAILDHSFSKLYGVLEEALGKPRAEQLINEMQESSDESFDTLKDVDSGTLSGILQVEHPQTVALVLAHVKREKAADILSIFSAGEKLDIIKRFLTMRESPADVKQEIAKRLWAAASTWSQGRSFVKQDNEERAKEVAELLHSLGSSKEILDGLAEESPDMAEKIKGYMLVFKDLFCVSTKDMQRVMSKVETQIVATALKGVDEALQDHILSAMSKRVRDIMLDEKENLGPLPADEVFQAQQTIMKEVKLLEEDGLIRINKGDGEGMLE